MALLDVLTPREDELAGELSESRFAAGLEDVVSGRAAAAYSDPPSFFAQTYPSDGLRILLNEALGRVYGTRSGASVIHSSRLLWTGPFLKAGTTSR